MADIKPGDEERESMLNAQTNEVKIVHKNGSGKKKGLDDASALEDFLRSINSTATLPGYIKGNNYSSVRGIVNQALVTCCVLVLSAAAGHPIGYSAVLLPQLKQENGTLFTDVEMGSWIASIHSAATPLGSAVSGPMMDYLGRRRALQVAMLPLLVGWALLATAADHIQILAGRIVCGLAVGAVAATAQVYLGEISEPRLRGMLIGTPFVAYSLGVLYVYVVGGATHWRATAWLSMVLPLASILALSLAPESPTWLARNGKLKAAAVAIGRLRGDDAIAKRELHQIISASEKERLNTSNASFLETILKMPVLKPLILINVFNTLQILCGTYVIIFYAVDIISETAKNVPIDTSVSAILTGVVRLIFTIVACFLLLAIGRRTLAIFSGAISAVSILILSILMYFKADTPQSTFDSYLNGACLMVYIAANTLGFMVLPGLMIGELLPAKVRGMCGGYIFMLFNTMLFGFTKIYPTMKLGWGMYGMFFLFGISSVIGTIFVYLMLPETKGKSLIEVEQYFQKPNFFWVTRDKNETNASDV